MAPEGIEDVRLKVLNNDNTLVISQSFDIPESLFDNFDALIEIDYNWMTAKKQLSFTLNYSSYNPLESITVYDNKTTEPVNIIIDHNKVENGVKYKIDISAQFENGTNIKSEDFIIPATKLKGWIIILVPSIILILTI